MTVSHAAEERILGGERQTDGLWVHRGKLSVGPPGLGGAPVSSGDVNANRGNGTGVYYFGGRSDRYLFFDGTSFNLVGAPLNFTPAANSIPTSAIQADAVEQLSASYVQQLAWTLPQSNAWTETPAQVTVTFGGNRVRIEFAFVVTCPTKGQRVIWGIMLDGAAPLIALGGVDAPEANYGAMANGCYYMVPSASTHRLGIGLYGPAGAAIISQAATTFYVTEQKR
jgi:hypothetical protein